MRGKIERRTTQKPTLLSTVLAVFVSLALTLTLTPPAQAATIIRDPNNVEVLVNKTQPLSPLTYVPPDLVTYPGTTRKLRSITSTQLQKLFAGAAAAGHSLRVTSAYRSYSEQASLYNSYVAKYGVTYANRISAKPGYSEHQTGLTADIGLASGTCGFLACFGDTAAGKWVAANAYRYGFVIRYPRGYEATTGYMYEPWHLRYVGVKRALELRSLAVPTLEHYYDGVRRAIPNTAALTRVVSGNLLASPSAFNGTWGAATTAVSRMGTGNSAVQSVDWNSDGILDVMWVSGAGRLYVLLGNRYGGFGTAIMITRGLAGTDFVADKFVTSRALPELAVRGADGKVRKYSRNGNFLAGSPTILRTVATTARISAADWNNDRAVDLLVNTPAATVAYLGSGTGTVSASATSTNGRLSGVTNVRRVNGASGPGTSGYLAQKGSTIYYYQRGATSLATGVVVGTGQLAK